MTILSVTELAQRTSSWDLTGKKAGRVFQIITDDKDTDPVTLYGAVDPSTGLTIPNVRQSHPTLTSLICTNVKPTQGEDRLIWNVSVDYETLHGSMADDTEESPLDTPPQVSWDVSSVDEVLHKDPITGKPIINSAKDRFDPPITKPTNILKVSIVRNELQYSAADADAYVNTVNASACTIAGLSIDAKQGKVTKYSGTRNWYLGIAYWQITYEIEFKTTWEIDILDQGLFYIDSGTGKKKHIKIEGKPVDEPQRLDGAGGILAVSTAPENSIFLTYNQYLTSNFSALGLASV